MKVLFVTNQFFFFRHIEPIASFLIKNDHQVALWFGPHEKKSISDRGVMEFSKRSGVQNYRKYEQKKDSWSFLKRTLRNLLGYRVYLKPGFTSPFYKNVFFHKMNSFSRHIVQNRIMQKILTKSMFSRFLRLLLYSLPPQVKIVEELRDEAPDVIVVVSNLPWDATELDYLLAGVKMIIPTVILIASWDNLTTKSTFNIIPDAVILWNKAIREEAVTLHDVPENKIIVAGAGTFDYLYSIKESCTHSEFCKKVGFYSDVPFVVYLGSSTSISGDETLFARKFAGKLYKELGVYVLIRPHPLNNMIWSKFEEKGAVVWPILGDLPDASDSQRDFVDTLKHSIAVIGVNTSAMIEAAIVDKPCITIKSEQYSSAQSEVGHFRHLLNGGFLEIAQDFDSAISLIKDIAGGTDRFRENRHAFVANFIRPNGVNQPVGPLIAEILERLYQRQDPIHIQNKISLK